MQARGAVENPVATHHMTGSRHTRLGKLRQLGAMSRPQPVSRPHSILTRTASPPSSTLPSATPAEATHQMPTRPCVASSPAEVAVVELVSMAAAETSPTTMPTSSCLHLLPSLNLRKIRGGSALLPRHHAPLPRRAQHGARVASAKGISRTCRPTPVSPRCMTRLARLTRPLRTPCPAADPLFLTQSSTFHEKLCVSRRGWRSSRQTLTSTRRAITRRQRLAHTTSKASTRLVSFFFCC